MGQRVQRRRPGIKPVPRSKKENDPYGALDTFTIRCTGSTIGISDTVLVHSLVVLRQSAWLQNAVTDQKDPEEPIRLPPHIRWWHLGLALEFMYAGRVPDFSLLAGEKLPVTYAGTTPRSIAAGFIELWQVGGFFGLEGLARRASVAFTAYMSTGIRHAIRVHRGVADDRFTPVVPLDAVLARPELRISYEFYQVAWKVFRGPPPVTDYNDWVTDYMDWLVSYDGSVQVVQRRNIAQNEHAILAWEGSMFDMDNDEDEDEDEDKDDEDGSPYTFTSPEACTTFRRLMLDVCMCHINSGLFELRWFQTFVSKDGPAPLREALDIRMLDLDARWPREEYPRAPFSFARVNPWRLVASNARPVPPRRPGSLL